MVDMWPPRCNSLLGWCFHLVLRADSLSAAYADHLHARDCRLHSFMLHNVFWCVLRHGHQAPTADMFTAICNDPYSFHIQSHVTVRH